MIVGAGVPWEIATRLRRAERMAYLVAIIEAKGGALWDWKMRRWVRREE